MDRHAMTTETLLDDEVQSLPAVLRVYPDENVESLVDQLTQRYDRLLDAWGEEAFQREQSRETRYEEEHARPVFPVLMRTLQHSTRPNPTVVLPDGRRAEMLDARRIRTKCGIQIVLLQEEVRSMRGKPGGTGLCRQCGGRHLATPRPPAPPPVMHAAVPCPKCQADLWAASYATDTETRHCIHCGIIVYRPLTEPVGPIPFLSEDDIAANEQAVVQTLARQARTEEPGDPEDTETFDTEEDLDAGIERENEEDDPAFDEEDAAAYDDRLSIPLLPETTPFSVDELQALTQIMEHPPSPEESGSQSLLVQRFIAQAHARLNGHDDPAAFPALFKRVVAEEVAALADLLHDPAFRFFQSGRSPLRRMLVDHAIQNLDRPAHRMAVWAAAGRLLQESQVPWLLRGITAYEADAPLDPVQRAHYRERVTRMVTQDTREILTYLLSLTPEDLALLAGDPDAIHPFLYAPNPETFEPTDRLLQPLIQYLAHELQRFRNKPRGCALLAKDHGLSVQALEYIARQSGQLPPTPTGSPTAQAA
jgi:hypothetical protein